MKIINILIAVLLALRLHLSTNEMSNKKWKTLMYH